MKKDLDNISQALQAWLDKYNLDVTIRGAEEDFFYYYDENTISYALTMSVDACNYWNRFIHKEMGCNLYVNTFFSAFLHEVGHSMTWDQLSEGDIYLSEYIKELLAEDEDTYEKYLGYYNTPCEIVATIWAVDFMNHNFQAINELYDTIHPMLMAFYDKYEVE